MLYGHAIAPRRLACSQVARTAEAGKSTRWATARSGPGDRVGPALPRTGGTWHATASDDQPESGGELRHFHRNALQRQRRSPGETRTYYMRRSARTTRSTP